MRVSVKIIGYIFAFVYVLPFLYKSILDNEFIISLFWYSVMVLIIDGTSALYDFFLAKHNQGVKLGKEITIQDH